MGYIFDFHDAKRYDQWILKRKNRFAADLESRLMLGMLDPVAGESVLDIGCGTGASIAPLLEKDLDVTGIDPSPYTSPCIAGSPKIFPLTITLSTMPACLPAWNLWMIRKKPWRRPFGWPRTGCLSDS